MASKRQRWSPGSLVRIALGNDRYGYAQMLDRPEYAFFDHFDLGKSTVNEVLTRNVLFRLWVKNGAHSSGRWVKIGSAPVASALRSPVLRFNQDPLSLVIRLGHDGVSGRVVKAEECAPYERAAVWDAEHVEDRLRDHVAGRPNRWALSLQPRR